MSIISRRFIALLALSVVLYWALPKHRRWWAVLLASIVFYAAISLRGLLILLAATALVFVCALRIQALKDELTQALLPASNGRVPVSREERKDLEHKVEQREVPYVVVAVLVVLSVLFVFKYLPTYMLDIFPEDDSFWAHIVAPLGISYYSLHLVGYLIDVKRDVICAETNPLKLVLFSSFFLSITQGPFIRYKELMPQLTKDRELPSGSAFLRAGLLMLWGYVKKLTIADNIALFVNTFYGAYSEGWSLGLVVIVACLYGLQLYADFSGYTDIMRGAGELFGLSLPENFRQPFFSRSISEFWQRWHISLGAWLKDYVFFPLLKSRPFKDLGTALKRYVGKKAARAIPTYLGMFVLWTCIGLWHGPSFHLLVSVGWLQFVYILVGELTQAASQKIKAVLGIKDTSIFLHILQSLRTTALMVVAWVFFRMESIEAALSLLGDSLSKPWFYGMKDDYKYLVDLAGFHYKTFFTFVAVSAGVLLLVDVFHEWQGISLRDTLAQKPYILRLAVYLGLLFALIIFGTYGPENSGHAFIYDF